MKNEPLSIDDFGVKDFSSLDNSRIDNAVAEMVKRLDLGSGSTNTINLYLLIKAYLKNLDSRSMINEVLKHADLNLDGSFSIADKRQSIKFWSDSMKQFIQEFDQRFYPEVEEELNPLRSKSEMKKFLDRLFHLHSMMVDDLMK